MLSLGSGAVSVNGKASETLAAETKEDAILEISSEEPIRGVYLLTNQLQQRHKHYQV